MDRRESRQAINELLGSAHLFVAALSGVMERSLLVEVAGKQVTLAQLKILKLIDLTEAHHVGDVAAFLGVSDAAASKTVDHLVRRKLLRRSVFQSDRRSSTLSLAAAGRKLLAEYDAAKEKKLASIFRDGAVEEMRRTTEQLEQLTRKLISNAANPEEICLQCGIYLQKRCLVREAGSAECQYQQRRLRRQGKNDDTEVEVSTRRRPGMGPPG